jgi:hypothetical protein
MRECEKYCTAEQLTIWRMLIACCLSNAANTHSEYVTFIAFPPQQRLHESASVSRYMYTACLVQLLLYRIAQKQVL